ncbi:MAG: glycosyltransferase family 2 protein [Solirubrobacteraceae bacterium]
MPAPSISVVVASHERPLRLLWLLNALEEQTLEHDRFEVVVCHDSRGDRTARLLDEHPLTAAGVLRSVAITPGRNPPGAQRNVGWRLARAPLVAFTDDDCRPPPTWLERALAAAVANPGAIVQGATHPDPDELGLLHACAHPHTQEIEPPVDWVQTCNVVYPKDVLERAGGFDERFEGGEDTDLAWRARAGGAPLVGAPEALTYHAVEPRSLPTTLRAAWRWRHLPTVVARHPQMRGNASIGRLFWKPRHARLFLALACAPATAGLPRRARYPLAAALAAPWIVAAAPSYGSSVRGRLRAAAELPGAAAVDAFEVAALAAGSFAARTVFL